MIAYFKRIADNFSGKVFKERKVYPSLNDPIQITKDSGAWAAHGTPTEIVPVSTLTSKIEIDYINVSTISAVGSYELILYTGLAGFEVEFAKRSIDRTATHSQEGYIPVNSIQIDPNTRISASLSGSPAGTESLYLKLSYTEME